MIRIIFFIEIIFFSFCLNAQQCHVEYEGNQALHEECICNDNTNSYEFRIRFYVLQDDDGSNGINESILDNLVGDINTAFDNSNISFIEDECQTVFINNTGLNSGWSSPIMNEEFLEALANENSDPNCLNIYLGNENHSINAGYAYFMNNLTYLTGSNSVYPEEQVNYKELSTYVHEIGHLLGLYHTHEFQFGAECFDRDLSGDCNTWECSLTGDLICDTQRDFNLSNNGFFTNVGTCDYDPNDELFAGENTLCPTDNPTFDLGTKWAEVLQNPDYSSINNYMSYSHPSCQNEFTPQQMNCMRNRIQNSATIQNALSSSGSKNSCECVHSQNFNSQSADLVFDGDYIFNNESFRVNDNSTITINGNVSFENNSFLHLGENCKIEVNGV